MNPILPKNLPDQDSVRVYCVDDHPLFLTTVVRLISREQQFEVSGTAANGEAAVREAARLQPDVILLDWMLPDCSGPEIIPALRNALPETRVIVITLLEGSGNREVALAAGADGFLNKQNLYRDLIPEIHRVVARPRIVRQGTQQSSVD